MRRVLIALCMIVIATGLWAAPKYTLVWANSGNCGYPEGEDFRGYPNVNEEIAADFERAHPGVDVNIFIRDVTQGSLPIDALMAQNKPPDVWVDAEGYFGNYLNDKYALPLEKYINVGIYQKNLIEKYTRNGHVYAIPTNQCLTALAINLDMLQSIGYKVPELKDWTTDEFLNLGAKLKAKGIPLTMVMGKGGFNTWDSPLFYAFGAEFYKNGDYSKTAINSPESLAALEYIKKLIDLGYAFPNPIEQNDDDAVEMFSTGKVFSCTMQEGHLGWIPEQVRQGKLDKAFAVTFVEFPHAQGRSHTAVYGYQTVAVAHATKDEAKNKLTAQLLEAAIGKKYQWYGMLIGGLIPTINGFYSKLGTASGISYQAITKIATVAPLAVELGQNPNGGRGNECSRIWKTLSQQWLRGKMTSQEFLSQFEKEANAVLASK